MTTQTTKRIYVLQDEPTGDEESIARIVNKFGFPVSEVEHVYKAMQQSDFIATLQAIAKASGDVRLLKRRKRIFWERQQRK